MNKFKKVALLLFLTCTLSTKATTQSQNQTQHNQRLKNPFHENMWSVYIQKKQPKLAFSIFANLVKKTKYAYKWLINFLHKTGNNKKLASMIPLIKAAFPDLLKNDPDTGFMVAYAIVRKNVIVNKMLMPIVYDNAAMDILLPLNKKFPSNQKVSGLLSTLYDLNNDPQNALAISEKYLNISVTKPTDFLEYFKNAARYLKLKNKNKALHAVKKCLDLQPKFLQGWILLATLHDQQGNTQEAINSCLRALELSGPNKAIEYMVIRLFFKLKKAQHRVSEFVMNKACFEKAVQFLRKKEHKKALEYIDKCLSEKTLNKQPAQKDMLKIKVLNNKNLKKI